MTRVHAAAVLPKNFTPADLPPRSAGPDAGRLAAVMCGGAGRGGTILDAMRHPDP